MYGEASRHYEVAMMPPFSARRFKMNWQSSGRNWSSATLIRGDDIFLEPGDYSPHASSGKKGNKLNLTRFVFDPLSLGLACRSLLEMQTTTLANSLPSLDAAKSISINPDPAGGQVLRCDFEGGSMSYHVDPDRMFAVTSVIKQRAGDDSSETVTSEYDRMTSDGVWFPTAVQYTRTKAGTVEFQEKLSVQYEAGASLTEDDFQVGALGLTEGRRVIDESLKVMVWDHGKLRRVTGQDVYDREQRRYDTSGAKSSTESLKQGRRGYSYTLLLAVNAAFAVVASGIYVARRRLASPHDAHEDQVA